MKILYTSILLSIILLAELPILKTGQTTEYYKGDNGTYQVGKNRSYTKRGDIIIDNSTGLIWQNDNSVKTSKMNWKSAIKYCKELNLYNYDNWKLPIISELKSIVKYDKQNPSINSNFKIALVQYPYYWTSTTYKNTKDDKAWTVYFNSGNDYYYDKEKFNYYVRCVIR